MMLPPCLSVLAGLLLLVQPTLAGEPSIPGPHADSVLITARDIVRGHIYPGSAPYRFRYDGLEGEILRIRVNGSGPGAGAFASAAPSAGPPIGQDKLAPKIELRRPGGPVLITAGDGSPKTTFSQELPFSGPLEILVSGVDGSFGGYKLRLSSRLPAQLRKEDAFTLTPQGHLIFAGRQGLRVSGTVRLPESNGLGTPPFLKLDGPLGGMDLTQHLKAKGDRLKLSGVVLEATGAHRLRFSQGADVRFTLRPGKDSRRKLNLVESLWPGRWVREDTVPGMTGRVFQLDAQRSGGGSFWRVETLERIVRSTLLRWKVAAATGGPDDRDLVLARQDAVPSVLDKIPPDGTEDEPPFGFFLFGFAFAEHDGDVLIDEEGYQWMRDEFFAPRAPEARVSRTNGYAHPDFANGNLVLNIDHEPGNLRYDLYRTNPGGELPARPQQTIIPRGSKVPVITWFDPFGTVASPPRYWVRAWRSDGPSVVSDPIDPPAP